MFVNVNLFESGLTCGDSAVGLQRQLSLCTDRVGGLEVGRLGILENKPDIGYRFFGREVLGLQRLGSELVERRVDGLAVGVPASSMHRPPIKASQQFFSGCIETCSPAFFVGTFTNFIVVVVVGVVNDDVTHRCCSVPNCFERQIFCALCLSL